MPYAVERLASNAYWSSVSLFASLGCGHGSEHPSGFRARWVDHSGLKPVLQQHSVIQRAAHSGEYLRQGVSMPTGTVKFYNDQKGYGFIAPDGGGNDVFVHATALERAGLTGLRENQKVSFETEVDRRSGKTAVSTIKLV